MRSNASVRALRALFVILAGLLLAGTSLLAQSQATSGQIVGTITDKSGGSIPGATVTATNKQTGFSRSAVTSDAGFYRLVALPSGPYEVVVENPGFQKATIVISVAVGTSRDANFVLQVGGVSSVVEVSGTGLESTRSEKGTIVDLKAIENLPINGRRFHDFVQSTPTVLVEPQRNQLSFMGQRGINGNISIDGADYNQPFFGGIRGGERSNSAFTIPQESIAEFQVTAQGFSPEFGRSSGGVVNAITRSGTNEIHGSAFYFLRHKAFGLTHGDCPVGGNAKLHGTNAFCQAALFTQQQWGGSFGGPIKSDKTFYFGAFERQVVSNPRQVLYSSLPATAPADGVEAWNYFKSLEGPYAQTNNATSFVVKLDHEFTSMQRISGRFNFSDNSAQNAVTAGTSLSPATPNALSTNGTEKDRSYTSVVQLTSSFSPTVINEFRFQWSREIRPRDANLPTSPNLSSAAGNFGTVTFLGNNIERDYRLQGSNGLTIIRGNHSYKLGADFNYTYAMQFFGFNQFGAFAYQTSTIATILENMSLGGATANRFDQPNNIVRYNHQVGNLFVGYHVNEFALFAQDNWRIRNGLTLNYGLRWESQWNPKPQADNATPINAIRDYKFPVGLSFDPTKIPSDVLEFMPRAGIAWSPEGFRKTVIRANAGMFYARTPMLVFAGPMNNFRAIPGDVTLQFPLAGTNLPCGNTVYSQLKAIGVDLNSYTLDKLPILTVAQVQSIGPACGLAVNILRGAQLLGVARDYKNPRSFQWALGAEHEIKSGWTAAMDFTYANTSHLQRTHDLNLNPPTIRATDGRPVYGPRALTDFAQIWIRESSARAMYNALVFRTNINRPKYQLNAFYTVSWNFSDDDNERSATFTDAQDQFKRVGDYGPSRLDRRHQVALYGTYSMPWGFQLGGSGRYYSSAPINPGGGSDLNADGDNASDRPFSAVGVTMPRNSFRNRPVYITNLRIAKHFKIAERAKVQFSVDLFNMFDNDNVLFSGNNLIYGPGINTTTGLAAPIDARFKFLRNADGSYNTVNTPGEPFQMQMGLKFIF